MAAYVTWKVDGRPCRYDSDDVEDVREIRHFMLHVSRLKRDDISEVIETAKCPTCGRVVPSIFEHVDVACETWGDPGTPEGDAAEAAYNAQQKEAGNGHG